MNNRDQLGLKQGGNPVIAREVSGQCSLHGVANQKRALQCSCHSYPGTIANDQPNQGLWLLEGCRRPGSLKTLTCLSASTTGLDWRAWQDSLSLHPDRWLADYVVQGIQNRFRIGFDYRRTQTKRVSSNKRSALEHPEIVQDYLAKECVEGRIFGPFDINQLPQVRSCEQIWHNPKRKFKEMEADTRSFFPRQPECERWDKPGMVLIVLYFCRGCGINYLPTGAEYSFSKGGH